MALPKKPKIDAEDFISGAKADNVETEKRNTVKTEKRKSANAEAEKKGKKIKMTFYMTPELYIKWKEYELKQLQEGNKISFQKVVEEYLDQILKT